MDHIGRHLKRAAPGVDKRTERGELLRYFVEKLNITRDRDGLKPLTMGRMGLLLQGIPTQDLYYLKSVGDKAENISKKFWWEIKPKDKNKE